MTTDTTERGVGRLICTALAGHPCDPPKPGMVAKTELDDLSNIIKAFNQHFEQEENR